MDLERIKSGLEFVEKNPAVCKRGKAYFHPTDVRNLIAEVERLTSDNTKLATELSLNRMCPHCRKPIYAVRILNTLTKEAP